MLQTLKDFFARAIEPGLSGGARDAESALQVATAALLIEMMRMDNRLEAAEQAAVVSVLRQRFGLAEDALERLLALAEAEAAQATDTYQFTSLINKTCDAAQKVRLIEFMWQVAYADGHLDAHEQHLMRKVADLLYISRGDYVAAKQRARAALQ